MFLWHQSRVANTHISVAEDCGVTAMFQVWSFKEECCQERGVPCSKHKIIQSYSWKKPLKSSTQEQEEKNWFRVWMIYWVLQLRVTEPGFGASSLDLGWQAGLDLPVRRFQYPRGMKSGVCHSPSLDLGDRHWPVWFSRDTHMYTHTHTHKHTHFILDISRLKSITKISALIIFECIGH